MDLSTRITFQPGNTLPQPSYTPAVDPATETMKDRAVIIFGGTDDLRACWAPQLAAYFGKSRISTIQQRHANTDNLRNLPADTLAFIDVLPKDVPFCMFSKAIRMAGLV